MDELSHARDALAARTRELAEALAALAAERAARAESDRVSRQKDEFLATLSHELRTPLTAILGWAKVLLLKRDDAASLERGLDAIARNAKAQARLIDELLDMNRLVAGKLRLELQPTVLAAVVAAAIEATRASAEAKEIRLQAPLDAPTEAIPGDPRRLQQALANVLGNAVKFTPRGGSVEVSLKRTDRYLEVTVRDDGVGIEPELLAQVFDRFRATDAGATRSSGGLGIGLTIARRLVELHGGSVSASSDGIGRGATFVVALPLAYG